jgi:hypothetical protein
MMARRSRVAATAMLSVALGITGALSAIGASPEPSASTLPSASPRPSASLGPAASASRLPVDCDSTAASLPRVIDGVQVSTTTTAGVSAIDPDDLLDPMLAGLGRTQADVCIVIFRYGQADDALAGQLLRIVDAHVPDLAGRFVAILRSAVVTQGGTASPSVTDLGGQTVWSLHAEVKGRETEILAWQLGDTLVVTSGLQAMDRLVEAVRGDLAPSPSMTSVSSPG